MALAGQIQRASNGAPAMRRLVLAYLYEEGQAAARAGRREQAEAYLQRALALDSENPDLWVLLGAVAADRDVRAICARRALELVPNYPPAQALLEQKDRISSVEGVLSPWTSRPGPAAPPAPFWQRWARSIAAAKPWRSPLFPARVLALVVLLVVVITAFSLGGAYSRHYQDRFFPGVHIAGVEVGGYSPAEAQDALQNQVASSLARSIHLHASQQSWHFSADALGLDYRIDQSCREALALGRSGSGWHSWWERLRLTLSGQEVPLVAEVREDRLQAALGRIAAVVDRPLVPPSAAWGEGAWKIVPGRDGRHVDQEETARRVRAVLLSGEGGSDSGPAIAVAVVTETAALSQPERALLEQVERAGRPLELRCKEKRWTPAAAEIAPWLQIQLGSGERPASVKVDPQALYSYLAGLAPEVERPVQQPRIELSEGRAAVFQVGQDGRAMALPAAAARIQEAIERRLAGEEVAAVELPVAVVPANDDALMAELGVIELVGEGTSSFVGSPENRVNNIVVGGQDLHGRLIAPGELFSLNQALDPISWEKGYRVAPIISEGSLVMGMGGGLCQVSTTLYRAALQAGLEIVERHPHQWRIEYYEQDSPPGFDATIIQGGPDFQFRNNTGHYLLIQVETDLNLYQQTIRFYGTSPDWMVTIDNLFISDDGLSVSYQRTVSKDGQVLSQETFYSYYQVHP